MSEKYIDLIDAIEDSDRMVGCERVTVEAVLEWLDSHPDQVPGRTITRSEFDSAVDAVEESQYATTVARCLEFAQALGITVVPDPEPTNAELIDEAYEVWDRDPQDFTFGEYLVRLGWTKAPGGDDE